jgi:hypothetical protein
MGTAAVRPLHGRRRTRGEKHSAWRSSPDPLPRKGMPIHAPDPACGPASRPPAAVSRQATEHTYQDRGPGTHAWRVASRRGVHDARPPQPVGAPRLRDPESDEDGALLSPAVSGSAGGQQECAGNRSVPGYRPIRGSSARVASGKRYESPTAATPTRSGPQARRRTTGRRRAGSSSISPPARASDWSRPQRPRGLSGQPGVGTRPAPSPRGRRRGGEPCPGGQANGRGRRDLHQEDGARRNRTESPTGR